MCEELTYEDRLQIMNGELYQEIYKKEKDKIDRCSVGWDIDADFFGHYSNSKKSSYKAGEYEKEKGTISIIGVEQSLDLDICRNANDTCELLSCDVELTEEELKKLEQAELEGGFMVSISYMKPYDVSDTKQG